MLLIELSVKVPLGNMLCKLTSKRLQTWLRTVWLGRLDKTYVISCFGDYAVRNKVAGKL